MKKLGLIFLALISLSLAADGQNADQNVEAKAIDGPEFRLSTAAAAAGIDGKLRIGLTIRPDGTPSSVRIFGGPVWPCGTNPKDELEEVRRAVKEHILAMKFSPAISEGKARSVDAQMDFSLRKRGAGQQLLPLRTDDKMLYDVGPINRMAVSLPRPLHPGNGGPERLGGPVLIEAIVDDKGNIASAGGYMGHPRLQSIRAGFCLPGQIQTGNPQGNACLDGRNYKLHIRVRWTLGPKVRRN